MLSITPKLLSGFDGKNILPKTFNIDFKIQSGCERTSCGCGAL
jgi:hypothetical protein